jgi:hypothetical protein
MLFQIHKMSVLMYYLIYMPIARVNITVKFFRVPGNILVVLGYGAPVKFFRVPGHILVDLGYVAPVKFFRVPLKYGLGS